MTSQNRMAAALKKTGIPAKQVSVYGRQIMITCLSETAAREWAAVVARFATIRRVYQGIDDSETGAVKVWRVAAVI